MITALTVNYNTPGYLKRLLSSFRKFYPDIPYLVIDGSDQCNYEQIKDFDKQFSVELIHFNYNIHHGPGLAYGISLINTPKLLMVDSDMIILQGGWLEEMKRTLRPDAYGTGDVQQEFIIEMREVEVPQRGGKYRHARPRPVIKRMEKGKVWIPYLHPALALLNRKVVIHYPMPIKGGAPLILAMERIWREGRSSSMLQNSDIIKNDFWNHTRKYVQHNDNHAGMGTVVSTGGYHLDLR